MKLLTKLKKLLLLALTVTLFAGCTEDKKFSAKPVITVTIEPLRYFTEQIVGDKCDVVTLVPAGSSPETYEPSTKQMMAIGQSALYIKAGNLGFERTWIKKLSDNSPHMIIVDSSDGIIPIHSINGIVDPHTWMSPANAIIISQNIYHSLCKIDASDSLYFRDRLTILTKRIKQTDRVIRKNLQNVSNRSFAIYHPTLTYFAHDYKLMQLPIEEEGKEPSAAQLMGTINMAQSAGIKLIFVQQEFSKRNTDMMASVIKARQVVINPLAYDWNKEIIKISQALKNQ